MKLLIEIPVEVYGVNVVLAVGVSDKRLKRQLKYKPIYWQWNSKYAAAMSNKFPDGNCIIRLRRKPVSAADYGHLAHEIEHTVQNIFDWIGEADTRECRAYLVGYLTRKIWEQFI